MAYTVAGWAIAVVLAIVLRLICRPGAQRLGADLVLSVGIAGTLAILEQGFLYYRALVVEARRRRRTTDAVASDDVSRWTGRVGRRARTAADWRSTQVLWAALGVAFFAFRTIFLRS
jgi:hypothetical protein